MFNKYFKLRTDKQGFTILSMFSGYLLKEELVLKKDQLFTVLPYIRRQYRITFDVYISSYGSQHWYSILHFTQSGNAERYGDRRNHVYIYM